MALRTQIVEMAVSMIQEIPFEWLRDYEINNPEPLLSFKIADNITACGWKQMITHIQWLDLRWLAWKEYR